jgi:Ala-tRNA(Pro) deacylase
MIENEKKVYDILEEMSIQYEKREHPPVYTCEEAKVFTSDMKGIHTKNLFLRNKKGNKHYLVVLEDSKTLNIKNFEMKIGEKNLSFASKERLMKHLGLTPGGVSVFGIINDISNAVILILDKSIFEKEHVNVHPNINTSTINLCSIDLKKFIQEYSTDYRIVNI